MPADLAADALAALLPDRPVRAYPAVLSTHADALAWARAGAPSGALVVADYQASPRGRAGTAWSVRARVDLGFSIVFRPAPTAEREGWTYVAVTTALADVLGADAQLVWPDAVERFGCLAARVGAELDTVDGGWVVVSVLMADVAGARGGVLADAVRRIETCLAAPPGALIDRYRRRCRTLGLRVRARLIPLGSTGKEITGQAETVGLDGALLVRTDHGVRIGLRPSHLGVLEALPGASS
jgi:BirA family transcriptional regulator, biotin operon repressor / biotin---[acetyl-CoA-carboxylase] ligase